MNKLECLAGYSQLELSYARILMMCAKKNFIEVDGLNVDVLLDKDYIEIIDGKMSLTDEGMFTILCAADVFAADKAPKMLEKRNTRKAREMSPEMDLDRDFIIGLLKDTEYVVSKVDIDRSNYNIVLEKRTNGIRMFEVSNKNNLRVWGYKMEPRFIKMFESIGCASKVAKNGNVYLDIPRTSENMTNVIDMVKSLCGQ